MAESYNSYVGNGTNRNFDISFNYIAKEHVYVTVDGASVPFTWVNDGRVQTVTAPAAGTMVRVFRRTPDEPLVIFTDTSVFKAANLNLYGRQSVAIAVEARDRAGDSLDLSKFALQQASDTVDTADAANAKADTALTTATTAEGNSTAALVAASTAESNSTAALAAASTALSTANSAMASAATALSTANSATATANTAQVHANTALTQSADAQTTAATALTNSSNAVSTANAATITANAASVTANAAMDAVEGIIGVDGFPSDQIDNQSLVPGANLTLALNDLLALSQGAYTNADGKFNSITTYVNATFSPLGHTHVWGDITGKPTTFTPSAHTHDDRYYTETEVDTKLGLKANIASPAFTGVPTAPTASPGTNNLQVATTGFVTGALVAKAPTASPTFTGVVTSSETNIRGDVDNRTLSFRKGSEAFPRYGYRIDASNNLLLGRYNQTNGAFISNVSYVNASGATFMQGDLINSSWFNLIGQASAADGGGIAGIPRFQSSGTSGSHAASMFIMQGANDPYVTFYRNGMGVIGTISGNGASGIAYNTTSDYRLKNISGEFSGALDDIEALKVWSGRWYSTPDLAPEPMMLAHEIAEVVPGAVTGTKDAITDIPVYGEDGELLGRFPVPLHQQVDYTKLIPTLVAAIKDLKGLVDTQQVEINRLKDRLSE